MISSLDKLLSEEIYCCVLFRELERCGILKHAVHRTSFPCLRKLELYFMFTIRSSYHAFDKHSDCHPRGEAVGVEHDIGHHTGLGKRHIGRRPQLAHNTLLSVATTELVSNHGVSVVAELNADSL